LRQWLPRTRALGRRCVRAAQIWVQGRQCKRWGGMWGSARHAMRLLWMRQRQVVGAVMQPWCRALNHTPDCVVPSSLQSNRARPSTAHPAAHPAGPLADRAA
jgi:hypothetical protein